MREKEFLGAREKEVLLKERRTAGDPGRGISSKVCVVPMVTCESFKKGPRRTALSGLGKGR